MKRIAFVGTVGQEKQRYLVMLPISRTCVFQ